jgi:pimeloyl-ACP methyl ester carboxylesterase
MRVVLLHALPFTGAMWADQLAWLPTSTLVPTLYGEGDSISDWAEFVLSAVDENDLVVVGASVGGFCALEVARLAPERVKAVVLVGSKAGVRGDDAARDAAVATLAERGFETAWQRYWRPLFGPSTSPEVVERAHADAASVPLDHVARGVRAFFDRPDLSEFARRWEGKLVTISGDHDNTPSWQASEQVAREALDGTFHLVADCGHYVNLERPKEFAALLAATCHELDPA